MPICLLFYAVIITLKCIKRSKSGSPHTAAGSVPSVALGTKDVRCHAREEGVDGKVLQWLRKQRGLRDSRQLREAHGEQSGSPMRYIY